MSIKLNEVSLETSAEPRVQLTNQEDSQSSNERGESISRPALSCRKTESRFNFDFRREYGNTHVTMRIEAKTRPLRFR